MSIAPTRPEVPQARQGSYFLAPFEKLMAPVVAGWARDDQELFWLAPKTPPPLTPAKVVGWADPQGCPLLFLRDSRDEPLGYLELNTMSVEVGHSWLGHCVLHPECRGIGLGRRMIQLALGLAFHQRRAQRVSLVVFPDNVPAIRCYRYAGFIDSGDQIKYFHTTGRQHRMLQMTIDRQRFEARQHVPESV